MKQPVNTHLSALAILLAVGLGGSMASAQTYTVAASPGYGAGPALHLDTAHGIAAADLPVVKVGGHKHKHKFKLKFHKRYKARPHYRSYGYRAPGYRVYRPYLKHKGYRGHHYRYAPRRYRRH